MATSKTARLNKQQRMTLQPGAKELSRRAYNLIIGLVVMYGILMNVALCYFVGINYTYSPMTVLISLLLYIICVTVGSLMAYKSSNPVISFIGFNFVCVPFGLMLSSVVSYYGSDPAIVFHAFFMTAIITAIMVLLSVMFPKFFERIGAVLFICLLVLVAVEFIALFIGFYSSVFALVGAAIFSLWIGADFARSQRYVPTVDNAIDSALDIYVDVVNLFLQILSLERR